MGITKVPQILVKYYLQRYPAKVRLRQFRFLSKWQRLQPLLEEIKPELFPAKPKVEAAPEVAIAPPTDAPLVGVQVFPASYRLYRCHEGDPLNCRGAVPAQAREQTRYHCQTCGFPALLEEKAEVRGRRGTYRIDRYLGRRGLGRLYAATQLGVEQPVVIKEYLLPQRYFNAEEMRQRQEAFANLAGLNLADGRVQDSRLITPLEAIVDDVQPRCYLVSHPQEGCPTLSVQLAAVGAMASVQVRLFLSQVLQTLEFLHEQKFSLPMGQVQTGLAHGNLTLNSLLWSATGNSFYIYVSDLALWESIFDSTVLAASQGSAADDLLALGYISFYLLAGRVVDEEGQPLDPKNNRHWNTVDLDLKQFILQLLQLETPFDSAAIARRTLIKLPALPFENSIVAATDVVIPQRKPFPIQALILTLLLLASLGRLAWVLFPRSQSAVAVSEPLLCCMAEVGAMPAGSFTYTGVDQGVWEYVLNQMGLPVLPRSTQTVRERLAETQPSLQLTYQSAESMAAAIAQVRQGEVDFAIVPLLQELPDDLEFEPIAYDGLVPFVAFSYSRRDRGLPVSLSGQITLDQLRQLYTGTVNNWQELNGSALVVKRYSPTSEEAVQLFEQRILVDERAIAQFRQLQQQQQIQSLPTFEMLRTVIRDFESTDPAGGIGFAPFSQVFGQCSVYPLALKAGRAAAIQPLVLESGVTISPTTDLCDRKGTYQLDADLFRTGRYPLAYRLGIVYLRDNSRPPLGAKFAEMLKTVEGQQLLNQAGLIPLRALPNSQPAPSMGQ